MIHLYLLLSLSIDTILKGLFKHFKSYLAVYADMDVGAVSGRWTVLLIW